MPEGNENARLIAQRIIDDVEKPFLQSDTKSF
jgi:hypothetical protein